ncbi:MAG: hypothetical protein PF505_09210 [Vallitaleaceae bacterium]|nr:hypothetical protein [Vallitaleaceae bacterium]
MGQIVPIIMILICCGSGAGAWFYMKKSNGKTVDTKTQQEQTAQEFVNVKDIHDRFLYTRD